MTFSTHSKAIALSDIFENQPLVITDAVLLEIGNALSRSFKPDAVRIIDYFTNAPEAEIVRLTPEHMGRVVSALPILSR